MARVFVLTALCLLCERLALFSQSPPPTRSFEVASVRRNPGPTYRISLATAGPLLTEEGNYMGALIAWAYHLQNYQLRFATPNLPDPYDIVAKAADGTTPSRDEFREMMRSLLADRFKLKVHHQMEEMPVYALVVAKNGPKLKEVAAEASPGGRVMVSGRNYEIAIPKADMDTVVQAISNAFLDRPVVDKTGLTGVYDLHLIYTPDTPANRRGEPGADDISVFTAVREQLGLALEPQKAIVDILVVDQIEKPSEN